MAALGKALLQFPHFLRLASALLYRAGNTGQTPHGEVKKRKLLSVDFYAQLSENSRYSLLTLRGEGSEHSGTGP